MSSDALVHFKFLLNTLGRAVEQLAECLAKQTKLSSQGQSTTIMQCQHKELKCKDLKDDMPFQISSCRHET